MVSTYQHNQQQYLQLNFKIKQIGLDKRQQEECINDEQRIDRIFKSLPFIYDLDQREVIEIQDSTSFYFSSQKELVLQKGQPLKHLIIVFKGTLGVYSQKKKKVVKVVEVGSIIGLDQLYSSTPNLKTYIALEDAFIGKIVVCDDQGTTTPLANKIIARMQSTLAILKTFHCLSLLSESNLLKIMANSKLQYYAQSDQFKCSSDQKLLVLSGKFKSQNGQGDSINPTQSKITFPKLQPRLTHKMEYCYGDMIQLSDKLDQLTSKGMASLDYVKSEGNNQQQMGEDKQVNENEQEQQNVGAYINCISDRGVLLDIQKSLYLKLTQFYQGQVTNKRPNKYIFTNQLLSTKESSILFRNSTSKDKLIIDQQSISQNSNKADNFQAIMPFSTLKSKPDTSNGKIQNFSVPKVDLDLFTRRSNVSPDQKQQFYECYSSRHYKPEESIKKSMLRNYSELTSRKNKIQQMLAQNGSNGSCKGFQNQESLYQIQQQLQKKFIVPFQQNTLLFQNSQEEEFQTILKFNSIVKSKQSIDMNQLSQSNLKSFVQDKSIGKLNNNYLNDQPLFNNSKNNDKIKDTLLNDQTQLSNLKIQQQIISLNKIKNKFIDKEHANITPNKSSIQSSFHYPYINSSQQLLQQQQQQQQLLLKQYSHNYIPQMNAVQNKQNISNQLYQSQSQNYLDSYSGNVQTQKREKNYHQVQKSLDFTGTEIFSQGTQLVNPKSKINKNGQSYQLGQSVKQFQQHQPIIVKMENEVKTRIRQNSDFIKLSEDNANYNNNSFYNEYKQFRVKTEDIQDQSSYPDQKEKNRQETNQFSALENINDFHNKTATFQKVISSNKSISSTKNQLSERQQRYINPSTQLSSKVFFNQSKSTSLNKNAIKESQKKENFKANNAQLFTFYDKPMFKSQN